MIDPSQPILCLPPMLLSFRFVLPQGKWTFEVLFSGAKSQTEFPPQNEGEGEKARQFFFPQNKTKKTVSWYSGYKRMFCRHEKWKFWKSKRNRNSPNGLVHGFCQKMAIFHRLFFLQNKAKKQKMFRDIADWKGCFLDMKSKVLKKFQKIAIFAKGVVYGFRQKMAIFHAWFVFFRKISQKKWLLIFWIEKVIF